jgi:hypothetical protein
LFLLGDDMVGREWRCPKSGQRIRFSNVNLDKRRMSDTAWFAWSEPAEILPYLSSTARERKLRLLYSAFCRLIWNDLTTQQRHAVETTERFADGLASRKQLMATTRECSFVLRTTYGLRSVWLLNLERNRTAQYLLRALHPTNFWNANLGELNSEEKIARCDVIRDLFDHLHHSTTIEPRWRTWNGGTIPKVAQSIYGEQSFSDLPILADALEEEGCPNTAVLDHCRRPGKHFRGCWVLDLLLGKK